MEEGDDAVNKYAHKDCIFDAVRMKFKGAFHFYFNLAKDPVLVTDIQIEMCSEKIRGYIDGVWGALDTVLELNERYELMALVEELHSDLIDKLMAARKTQKQKETIA